MLDAAAPWTSPWLPPRYEQNFWNAALHPEDVECKRRPRRGRSQRRSRAPRNSRRSAHPISSPFACAMNGCRISCAARTRVWDHPSQATPLHGCPGLPVQWNQKGPAGPQGPPGVVGELYRQNSVSFPVGLTTPGIESVTVSCPQGYVATGGGFALSGPIGIGGYCHREVDSNSRQRDNPRWCAHWWGGRAGRDRYCG